MIRFYCDSNIFRLLKNTHPAYSHLLCKTFDDLYGKVLFIYSDAHLDDLKDSINLDYLAEDLTIIEKYTQDNYFSYDLLENHFICYSNTAKEAFSKIDYTEIKSSLQQPFDINKIFSVIDPVKELASLKNFLDFYLKVSISSSNRRIEVSKLNEDDRKMLNKMIPGYNTQMTSDDIILKILQYATTLLVDKQEMTELRRYAAKALNNKNFSFRQWGAKFESKFTETVFKKPFLEIVDSTLTEKQRNDECYRFTYAYSLLESLGITQERNNNNKIKKFTYDSMNRDGTHAYFASKCDYLITDDKGLIEKAGILYDLFRFNTKILTSEDFINSRTTFLINEETLDTFLTSIQFDLIHSLQLYEYVDLASLMKIREFKTTHNYFNYFNRLQIITPVDGEIPIYVLYCSRHIEANFYLFREIELLVDKMLKTFGPDEENRGKYSLEENNLYNDGKDIRSWKINQLGIRLNKAHRTWGIFLILTINGF